MNIFWGMKIFVYIFFGVITKLGLYLWVISMRVFSQGQGTEWVILGGGGGVVKISNIFGVLEISETVDAGPEPTTEEKNESTPPPPPPPG